MPNVSTHNLEYRLLGWALDTGKDYGLSAEDFQDQSFQLIWMAFLEARKQYQAVDYVILGEFIHTRTGYDERDFLQQVWESRLDREELAESYADRLRDLRSTLDVKHRLADIAQLWENPEQMREQAMDALRKIKTRGQSKTLTLLQVLPLVLEDIEKRLNSDKLTGIGTGLPTLDEKTGGFQDSDLTILAARPAVGKTALMLCLALAAEGKRVAIVSAEQPAAQLVQRMISIQGAIAAWKLRNPKAINQDEWPFITQAVSSLKDRDLHIFDAAAPTMSRVETKIDELDPDVVFVDYLQRIKAPGQIYERTSAVALACKELARNFSIPVVALAQINRAGAQGAAMHHLKGSGDIEQEADQVLILERSAETPEQATLTLEKNRHGPTGTIDLHFRADTMRFSELARYEE